MEYLDKQRCNVQVSSLIEFVFTLTDKPDKHVASLEKGWTCASIFYSNIPLELDDWIQPIPKTLIQIISPMHILGGYTTFKLFLYLMSNVYNRPST